MCRLAFDFSDKIEISDIEIRRKGKSYTSDTLRALTKEGRQLFFLCGTDMLLTLDCWHEPEVIFALADIVCVAREDDMALRQSLKEKAEEYKVRFGARVHLLSVPAVELSSSRVRTAVMQDESLDGLLPEGVFAYIKEKGLYK